MSLTKKRVHLYEVKDGITYDEDVDVYTSTNSVLFDDGESLQDKLDNGVLSVDILGNLEDLGTENKSSMVASLNEINEIVQSNGDMLSGGESEGGYAFAFGREVLDGSWKSVSTLPYNFYQGSAVVYNDELHILGSGATPYTQHYKWNGSAWESVSTLPYSLLGYERAVVYNDELHIIGSDNSANNDYRKHYKWDGISWSSVSTTPYTLTYVSAITYDGCIHLLGGYATTSEYKYHYKWDGNSWVSSTSLPYYFYNGGSIVYNNELHIFGSGYGNYSKNHYKYNGASWSNVSTLPASFYYSTVVILNNNICITTTVNSTTTLYKYNGSSWVSLSTLPYNTYCGNGIVYNGQLHMLGSNTSNYYTRHYKLNSGTLLSGYVKSNTQIYQPNGHAYSDNLATLDNDMFEATQDGLVEILLEE